MSKTKPRTTNIEKRRRLSELYVKGREVRFNEQGVVDSPVSNGKHQTLAQWGAAHEGEDAPEYLWPSDDDIVIWVQPPDPLQREEAVRSSQAARARAMLAAKDLDAEEGAGAEQFVSDLSDEQCIEYLLQYESRDLRSRAIQEVLEEGEWEDFTALQDSMREWEEEGFPDGPEWDALIKRDREYGEQVRTRIQDMLNDLRESLKGLNAAELRKRSKKKYTDSLGNQAFMQKYEVQMLFRACRDDEDRRELFFENDEELLRQPEFVQIALADALAEFIKEPGEAKNSRRVVPGSPQLVPPVELETSEASTPEEQTA